MRKKVFAVDDDPEMIRILEQVLQTDYELQTAMDGEDALNSLPSFTPDLIILDIMLPDMNGYEICTELKKHSALKNIPVLMLSSNKGTEARIKGYQVGAINYIEKPFNREELKTIVRNLITDEAFQKEEWSFEDVHMHLASQTVRMADEKVEVTRFEFKILLAMIKQPGLILSRDYLLELLYPDQLERVDRLIDSHISHLRKKLRKTRVAIKSIYGKGYKLVRL